MAPKVKASFKLEPAGGPFHDPALLVTPANSSELVLLDAGTLHALRTRNLMKVRWLFLTHLHIDHVIGFDHLLRVRLFSDLPLHIFGPPGTAKAIGHRLQGYAWNLTSGSPFVIHATDLPTSPQSQSATVRYACQDRFLATPGEPPIRGASGEVCLEPDLKVSWYPVNHGVACYCYRIDQSFPPQFSLQNCHRLGLLPGPWVRKLTSGQEFSMEVEGQLRDQRWLAEHLLQERPTVKLGYLTDTLLDSVLAKELSSFFKNVDVLVCESAYLEQELEAATQNLHMTTAQVARLAGQCGVGQLLLFHLSRRHQEKGPQVHLAQARRGFANTDLLSAP
ncbi:MAG: hypothetical protein WC314_08530 [Vulcanimicrobiota bacterium]